LSQRAILRRIVTTFRFARRTFATLGAYICFIAN
jgi:hypothetical protein